MRASKSATGSVKLIFVYLLLSSPVCSGSAGEPAVTYCKTGYWLLAISLWLWHLTLSSSACFFVLARFDHVLSKSTHKLTAKG
jgi:hypothetical protein